MSALRKAWIILSATVLSCAAPPPSPLQTGAAPKSQPVIRVALSADARTLVVTDGDRDDRARNDLAEELNRTSGHNVIVFRRSAGTDLSTLRLNAAEQNAAALLLIQHATGSPDEFITATLRSVETDDLLADTAVPRGPASETIASLKNWYASVSSKVTELPPFSAFNLLKRFEKEGHCSSALELLKRHEFTRPEEQVDSQRIAETCRQSLYDEGVANPTVPLHVRTDNVSPRFQTAIFDRATESTLLKELQTFYHQVGELLVLCQEECQRGRIRLTLPYDSNWYKGQKSNSKEPLKPYERLARALIDYRGSLRKTITTTEFPLEIVLTDPSSSLAIDVEGPRDKPTLKAKSNAPEFFHLEP